MNGWMFSQFRPCSQDFKKIGRNTETSRHILVFLLFFSLQALSQIFLLPGWAIPLLYS